MRLDEGTSEHSKDADPSMLRGTELVGFLEALQCAACVFDDRQRILMSNRRFVDLLDATGGLPCNLAFSDLVDPHDAARLAEFMVGSESQTAEQLRVHAFSGRLFNARVHFSRLTSAAEPGKRVLGVVVEHRPSDSLSETPSPGDEAQAFAKVANWELEIASGQVRVSRTWFDIWGFDPAREVKLDAVLRHIHPADRETALIAIRSAVQTGTPFRFRHRIVRPDGVLRWAESTGRAEGVGVDGPERLSGVVLDITEQQEAEAVLARYYDLISASPDRIAFLDRSGCLLAANAAFLTALEIPRAEGIGRPLKEMAGSAELARLIRRNLGRCLDGGHPIVEDLREVGPEGEVRESEVRLFPHRDTAGTVTGIVVNVRDVTSVRESERRLLQSAAVYAATSDGLLITDAAGRIVAVNAAFTQITGYAEAELLGRKPSLLNSHWHTATFFTRMWRRLLKQGSWEGEIWNRRKDGEIYLQKLSIRRVLDTRGAVTNFVGLFAEPRTSPTPPKSTDLLAHYDPLTKLPNRTLFDSRLAHALDPTRRNRTPVALFLVDLDHFANLNASLGHAIGDETLRAVGLRLRETIRPADTLARFAGNQFGLLLEGVQGATEAEEIARRLRAALRRALAVRGHQVYVTASMGIALDADSDNDPEVMVTRAEAALLNVKRSGRDGFRIASQEPGGAAKDRQRLVDLMREGLDTGAYELFFQPRVEIETGRWAAAEVRLRWHQPDLGLIPFERFLPLAESSGILVDLGQWVLAEACRRMQDWRSRGVPVGSLAIGVSAAQLTRYDLVAATERALQAAGIQGNCIDLEFPESLLFKHPERTSQVFGELQRIGVGLALSEAGTSWVALSQLRRLPIGRLKIHHGFIDALPDSKDDLAVIQALTAMGQALELGISADGVRDDRQRQLLLTIGCGEAQGDLFAPPLSASHFERCLMQVSGAAPDPPMPAPRASP